MARKGKDLFVLLGERAKPRSPEVDGSGKAGDATAGGWLRALLGGSPQPMSRAPRRPTKTGRSRRSAPAASGLMVPGWFVILLVLMGVTAGFVAGRWTGHSQGDPLTAKVPQDGVVPGKFEDGDFRRGGRALDADRQADRKEHGYLAPEKQQEQLSKFFFVVLVYAASQRDRAETLARYLREQGLERTRIREFQLKGGGSRWVTLCYVDITSDGQPSEAHAEECFGQLKRVQYPDFEPRFAAAVELLESAATALRKVDISGQ
ncbi:MAG: hypothetical protein V3U11_01390 [Planctomycetota bacterium]